MNQSKLYKKEGKSKEPQMEYSFDEKSISSKQAKLEFILNRAIREGTVNDYDTLKHKGVTYNVGDNIQVYSTDQHKPYVAQLTRIVKAPLQKLPFVQVKWCFKKGDLSKSILQKYGEHISSAEVFPSELTFCLFIQSIKCKCFILSVEEYGQMVQTYEYYYFSRASYSNEKEQLIPNPQAWKKECICQMPVNPEKVYVQCGNCEKWFHDTCVEVKDLNQTFICSVCLKNKKHSFKK